MTHTSESDVRRRSQSAAGARPAAQEVLAALRGRYGVGSAVRCDYLTSGLHHTYLLRDGAGVQVCRVYRRAWRSHEACLYELDVLEQLAELHCPVSRPLRTRDGQLAIEATIDGSPATIAVFSYAAGQAPGAGLTPQQADQLGRATATLHRALGTLSPSHARPPRDWAYLVEGPLGVLSTLLPEADSAELRRDSFTLRAAMPALPLSAPCFGIVHGDINLKNVHFAGRQLTFIDFDDCGPGWYAYDIGKFFHASGALPMHRELQAAFLDAYCVTRSLSAAELRAIGVFAAVAHLWIMGVHAYNAEYLAGYLNAEFWRRRMTGWRGWLAHALAA